MISQHRKGSFNFNAQPSLSCVNRTYRGECPGLLKSLTCLPCIVGYTFRQHDPACQTPWKVSCSISPIPSIHGSLALYLPRREGVQLLR